MGLVGITDQLWAWGRQLLRPSGPLPRPSRRSQVFDAILALGVSAIAIPGSYGVFPRTTDPLDPLASHHVAWAVVMLLIAAPLTARRRFPLAVLWIVMAMGAVVAAVTDDRATIRFSFYVCLIAAYSAAVYSPYRMPVLVSQLVAALLYSQLQQLRSPTLPTVSSDAVPALVLIPLAIAADGLRRWRRRADEERTRTTALERERDEASRRAAEQERARIARELHDVVTHNVSMMVIQAGAARKVMATSQEQAREALLAVEAGGRAAMSELRHVMGLLTMNTDDPAGPVQLVPQPGLDRLDALIAGVRASGVPVELTVAGQPRPMPGGIELAAYRVVQEALTNTVKHAGGASATVIVDYGAAYLRLEVADTGGAPRAAAATGNGRGLIGLRERLAVYGGTVHAGPRPRGGYRVRAHIPLEAS
ncbi:sensor histidine kinase [Micromonospora rubida]